MQGTVLGLPDSGAQLLQISFQELRLWELEGH